MTTQELKTIARQAIKVKEQADSIKDASKELYSACDNLLVCLSNKYLFDDDNDPKTNRR
jgi:uncharacterized protein (DUF3084 family)